MTYRFIDQHKDRWPVRLLCQTLEVAPAGYYTWRQRPHSQQQQRRDILVVEMRAIHAEVKARYGSPRIHKELVARGPSCCVNSVAKLMPDNPIQAKTARKFRVHTTHSGHDLPVADNLLDRQIHPSAANEVWVKDITYISTGEGWLFLAAVEDLYSRRVVGWSMAEHRESRWSSMLWRWWSSVVCPMSGYWPIRIEAASTPANITRGSWVNTAFHAA